MIEKLLHRGLVRRIGFYRFGTAGGGVDGAGDLGYLLQCPAGDDDVIALVGQQPAEGCAETLFRSHSNDDGAWRAHSAASSASSVG